MKSSYLTLKQYRGNEADQFQFSGGIAQKIISSPVFRVLFFRTRTLSFEKKLGLSEKVTKDFVRKASGETDKVYPGI